MKNYPIIQVDAFADKAFAGNPAAVMPLDGPLDDELMQSIAMENNLAETAFFWPEGDSLRLRWFTPTLEVELCGHATLASAHVWFTEMEGGSQPVSFETRSGTLTVQKTAQGYQMDFPAKPVHGPWAHPGLAAALGATPDAVYTQGTFAGVEHVLCVFNDADTLRALAPDMSAIKKVRATIMTTAPESEDGLDFISRFFAPTAGVDEDPVTGSAHCTLTPYWAKRLDKNILNAYQASSRGGYVMCELDGARVKLSGQAVTTLKGDFIL
ncbi:MAG: PhzF family phenazine biosynthesis protein [Alphaproteobacteria bacterium]